jgi:hypothetical protein
LSILFVVAVVAVYGLLVGVAEAGPTGGSAGTAQDLLLAGALAVVLGAVGVVVSLGAAPRAVEISEDATVVVGRFGRRYRFPRPAQLRTTVLARYPAGLLAPVAVESVEIAGGSSRRSFLLDEGILTVREAPAP